MFFVHERGRMISVYLFAQQLGSMWVSSSQLAPKLQSNSSSSLGLITGGSMADTVGWRWSQSICGFIFALVLIMFTFSFEETLFPRFLFASSQSAAAIPAARDEEAIEGSSKVDERSSNLKLATCISQENGVVDDFPKRTYLQMLKPWTRYPQNKTTFWQYFRRPFFLWGFPNVVIVSDPHSNNAGTTLTYAT